MNIIAELKSITRTRKILNSLLWVIVGGAVFYSLMTSTPLVSDHSQWSWSGWALGLLTDAAFVLAISADAVLSKHGMNGGKWAVAFRWVTGAASLFLNTWGSVSEKDWVGVAIHSIAPAVLVCAAEVAPAYRRRFRDLELQLSGSQSQVQSELTEVHGSESEVHTGSGSKPEVHSSGSHALNEVQGSPSPALLNDEVQSELAGTQVHSSGSQTNGEPRAGKYLPIPAASSSGSDTEVHSSGSQVHSGLGSKVQGSKSRGSSSQVQVQSEPGSNGEVIRAGFMNQRSASEVAREIGVSGSYVSRKYKELREELTA